MIIDCEKCSIIDYQLSLAKPSPGSNRIWQVLSKPSYGTFSPVRRPRVCAFPVRGLGDTTSGWQLLSCSFPLTLWIWMSWLQSYCPRSARFNSLALLTLQPSSLNNFEGTNWMIGKRWKGHFSGNIREQSKLTQRYTARPIPILSCSGNGKSHQITIYHNRSIWKHRAVREEP